MAITASLSDGEPYAFVSMGGGYGSSAYGYNAFPTSYSQSEIYAAPLSLCPAGTYSSVEGSTSAAACLACPAGAYCEEGSKEPTPCPIGTFQSELGVLVVGVLMVFFVIAAPQGIVGLFQRKR